MELLANPDKWFPPVDQVDRPYFIAIEKDNRVYSEYTNFNAKRPVASSENNWYEHLVKDGLQYFKVKGRYGRYWLDMKTGLIFFDHGKCFDKIKDSEGNLDGMIHLEIQGVPLINTEEIDHSFKLKHFKVNDETFLTSGTRISNVTEVYFGWEITDFFLGRITFEGIVYNREPRFDVRVLFTPKKDFDNVVKVVLTTEQDEWTKTKQEIATISAGEKWTWQENIL